MTDSTTYYVESGEGDRLSDKTGEATARNHARAVRERLCRVTTDDGCLLEDSLVFDYGVSPHGPDDVGATQCDECEMWTIELISSEHTEYCSLNPENIVQSTDSGCS